MFPNFTPEIILQGKSLRTYQVLRVLVYFVFAAVIAYFFFLIFFPSENFTFSFLSPGSKKNNAANPRDAHNIPNENGKIYSGNSLVFDTPTVGKYSRAEISLTLDKKSGNSPLKGEIKARKSYEAFLYPLGDSTGFKDGTLIKHAGDFFMVSDGKIRKFQPSALDALGFDREAFLQADENDLAYNPRGEDIYSSRAYPNFSLFKVDDAYYMKTGESLKQFVSEKAYLSHYGPLQAIAKNEEFLSHYALDPDTIGFSDGTLVSYGESAYIVSGKKILPINNPITFEASGYLWEDLMPVSGDEIAMYEKGELFRISSVHPDGTILSDALDSAWYIVKEKKKSPLPTSLIAQSWIRKSPIAVSMESVQITNQCQPRNGFLFSNRYTCEIPVANMQSLIGKDYEFNVSFDKKADVDDINVEFKRDLTFPNFKSSLSDIIQRIKINYANQLQIKIN